MEWSGKRVVVTGAAGFIGSHLTEALLGQGAHVKALVKYNGAGHVGHLDALPDELKSKCDIVFGDVTDGPFCQHLLKGAEVVFHLAALIGIPYSYIAPQHYVNTNIQGTLNILQAALDQSVSRVVHTSTSEAYGTAQYAPIDEQHPLQGQSPYSASKISADMLAESYYRSFELPVATIRPFNTYGPRQSERAFIPAMIQQALRVQRGEQEVIRCGDLTPQRDLNFVTDTVAGFLAVGAHPEAVGQVWNIGSGQTQTMEAVLETILNLTGCDQTVVQQDPRRIRPAKSEVMLLQCDATKANNSLGWQSTVSLEAGIAHCVDYYQQQHSRPKAYVV